MSRALNFGQLVSGFQFRKVGGPLGMVEFRAAQPASLEAIPKQDRVHLPGEFIDAPGAAVADSLAGCRLLSLQSTSISNQLTPPLTSLSRHSSIQVARNPWTGMERAMTSLLNRQSTESKAHIVALHCSQVSEACSNQYHAVTLDISGNGKNAPCHSSSFSFPHDERR